MLFYSFKMAVAIAFFVCKCCRSNLSSKSVKLVLFSFSLDTLIFMSFDKIVNKTDFLTRINLYSSIENMNDYLLALFGSMFTQISTVEKFSIE